MMMVMMIMIMMMITITIMMTIFRLKWIVIGLISQRVVSFDAHEHLGCFSSDASIILHHIISYHIISYRAM